MLTSYQASRWKRLFGLKFYIPVHSYGHVETVSSSNHTFSWASLTKRLTSTCACSLQMNFLNQRKRIRIDSTSGQVLIIFIHLQISVMKNDEILFLQKQQVEFLI